MRYVPQVINSPQKEGTFISSYSIGEIEEPSYFACYMVNLDRKKIAELNYGDWPWYAYPQGEFFTIGSACIASSMNDLKYAKVDIGPRGTDIHIPNEGYHSVSNLAKPFSEEGIPFLV